MLYSAFGDILIRKHGAETKLHGYRMAARIRDRPQRGGAMTSRSRRAFQSPR
jgi:hypothetical protein